MINNLELAALVLGWMVLEHVCEDLIFKHIEMFCDNTSVVAWAYKGGTSKSIPTGRLLWLLSIRQRTKKASSLLLMQIVGENNAMADIPSRAFKNGEFFHTRDDLVKYLNSHFPLPQNLSSQEFQLSTKMASRVISYFRGTQLPMESLHRLPKLGKNIGNTGQVTVISSNLIPSCQNKQPMSRLLSLLVLPPGYGPGLTETAKQCS